MSSSPRPGPQLAVEPDVSRAQALVAQYGGACNIPPTQELPRKLDLLLRLCDACGRDYGAIEKTAPFAFDVGPDG